MNTLNLNVADFNQEMGVVLNKTISNTLSPDLAASIETAPEVTGNADALLARPMFAGNEPVAHVPHYVNSSLFRSGSPRLLNILNMRSKLLQKLNLLALREAEPVSIVTNSPRFAVQGAKQSLVERKSPHGAQELNRERVHRVQ